ncbi:MAG: hypothetical protein ABR524_03295 [Thermoanaerobaculia bacterium]
MSEQSPGQGRRDRQLAFGIFLLVFLLYGYFCGGGGWAQNSNFALTRSLALEGDVFIDEYRDTTGDLSEVNGRVISNKAPGLSILGVPAYWLSRTLVPGEERGIVVTLRGWLTNLFSNALLSALVPPLLFVWARREGVDARRAAFLALLIGVATPLLPWATVFFLHGASGALALMSWLAARSRARGSAFLAGLAGGTAALCNYLFLPILVPLVLLAMWPEIRSSRLAGARRAAGVIAGAALPLLAFAAYQLAATGQIFFLPLTSNETFVTEDALFGILNLPGMEAVWGITFSPYRGLFYLSPLLLLAIPGAAAMYRARKTPDLLFVFAVLAAHFGMNLSFNNWEGGFGIGPRYLVSALPLMSVLVIEGALKARMWAVVILAVVSFANVFAATAVDPLPSGSIPRPLGGYIYPLLLTGEYEARGPIHPRWSPELFDGHTSVNRMSIDEIVPFAKYPPGDAGSEWAAFNIGEVLAGPGHPASLLPPILLLLLGGALMARLSRPGPSPGKR